MGSFCRWGGSELSQEIPLPPAPPLPVLVSLARKHYKRGTNTDSGNEMASLSLIHTGAQSSQQVPGQSKRPTYRENKVVSKLLSKFVL